MTVKPEPDNLLTLKGTEIVISGFCAIANVF